MQRAIAAQMADCIPLPLASTRDFITHIRKVMKPIAFLGGSLDDLRGFPADARRQAGYQLDRVQRGHDPDDWRPMQSIGSGAREIGFATQPEPSG